jgi:serine/threonine protein kinase/tetratricopeptide (TPR) repeat protein
MKPHEDNVSAYSAGEETTVPASTPGTGRPQSHTFTPNEVVGRRFKILRFIGQGGMGEVYEAEDLELQERVALKTIRPEISSDERTVARFKQEILLTRKVTHRNVCRIFDLFRDQRESGEVIFVTMELLRGETLAERLRRQGSMSTAEALPIIEQMATALAAAHREGIVHRDFKSANVMLLTAESAEGAPRSVVTDFGLARSISPGGMATASLTGSGEFVGTPTYMAPEQLEGGPISRAVDIYALGVVMYEMVTGASPFTGDSPLAVALKRLKESPVSPRTHVPSLETRWEASILRCLEREPAKRFATATQVVTSIKEEAHKRQTQIQRSAILLASLVTAVLLVLVTGVYIYKAHERPPVASGLPPDLPSGLTKARRSVAVLGFKNLSEHSDTNWLSTALSEMLTNELAAGEKLRTIPGENVARMRADLALADADDFGQSTLGRIRKNLGTDFVVIGSYFATGTESGGKIRLDLRLQDAVAGETVASVSDTGNQSELLDLVSRAGARLRDRLGAGGLSPLEATGARATQPANAEAQRLYAEGLEKLRLFDDLAARDLFVQAIAADSQHPLSHSGLATAWSGLGYKVKAQDEAKRALDLSAKLTREERLWVEARYRQTTNEGDKAVEIYRSLWNFFPDNLEYGLALAEAQTSAGKAKDAIVTLGSLRKLPAPASDDPRIDLAEASAAYELSDYRKTQAAAAKAGAEGTVRGARLLVAEARSQEGSALHRLGEPTRAVAALDEATQIYTSAGDRGAVASTMLAKGAVFGKQGDWTAAQKTFEDALTTFRQIGNKGGMASALNDIAEILRMERDFAGASRRYEEALPLFREVGHRIGVVASLNNIGALRSDQGDLVGARKMYEEALAIAREDGDKHGGQTLLGNLAEVLFFQGDLTGAQKSADEALTAARQIGVKHSEAVHLSLLGAILTTQSKLSEARKAYEEALAIRSELREKTAAAESRISLTALLIEEGRSSEAETASRAFVEEFGKEKAGDLEAQADLVQVRSLLALGRPQEARAAIEHATALSQQNQRLELQLSLSLQRGRVAAALGNSAEARRTLQDVHKKATTAAWVEYQLQALLALGEMELKTADSAGDRAQLKTLETQATSKGFVLIARKAHAALSDQVSTKR